MLEEDLSSLDEAKLLLETTGVLSAAELFELFPLEQPARKNEANRLKMIPGFFISLL